MRIALILHIICYSVCVWESSVSCAFARAHIDPVDEITQELYKKSERSSNSKKQKKSLNSKNTKEKSKESSKNKKVPSTNVGTSKKEKAPLSKDELKPALEKKEESSKKDSAQAHENHDTSSKESSKENAKDATTSTQPLAVITSKDGQNTLPLPRFVSIKATAAHLHVGPGDHYPIEWRYVRQFLPVEVLLEFDHWRQIRDIQGTVGWVHKTLLSSRRFVMVQNKVADLHKHSNEESAIVATVEPGVIGKLVECTKTMCHIDIQGVRGWISRDLLFGTYPDETQF